MMFRSPTKFSSQRVIFVGRCVKVCSQGLLRRLAPAPAPPKDDKSVLIYFSACTQKHGRLFRVPCFFGFLFVLLFLKGCVVPSSRAAIRGGRGAKGKIVRYHPPPPLGFSWSHFLLEYAASGSWYHTVRYRVQENEFISLRYGGANIAFRHTFPLTVAGIPRVNRSGVCLPTPSCLSACRFFFSFFHFWQDKNNRKVSAAVSTVTVHVTGARGLKSVQMIGTQDPYVKGKLLLDGYEVCIVKSNVFRCTPMLLPGGVLVVYS